MRLSLDERSVIKKALFDVDNTASVYLFGSRVYDAKKGGDIDLLVFSNQMDLRKKIKFEASLWKMLGEQKIDVVVAGPNNQAFVNLISEEAILL
jgi:predicted nucleotidyltransferase